MKIYPLPVSPEFQPDRTAFRCPAHGEDWGVEQDAHRWLAQHPEFVTGDPEQADWDYLPLFWNRLYINWSWGQEGLDRIQAMVLQVVSRHRPTFTICEYDIALMQPDLDLCNMLVFCASRQDDASGSVDVPLLCSPHEVAEQPERRWLASFMGNSAVVSPRIEMAELLRGRDDVSIERGDQGEAAFVRQMLASYIALAPRGHGGQSFRFYEAMQLGVTPMLIGVPDTRPFKGWIDWEACSLYATDADAAVALLDEVSGQRARLAAMGREAKRVYDTCLRYGYWPWLMMEELRTRT